LKNHPTEPEFFDWQGIIIHQDELVHKVGTDAVLLGSWVPRILPDAKTILDIGAGSGILALMMARCYPQALVCAIDVDDKAVQLTARNIKQAKMESRIEVSHEDILKSPADQHQFELVICNPPYHLEQIFPNDLHKQRAKHIPTTIVDWLTSLSLRILKDGHLMIVIPSSNAFAWVEAGNNLGYHNHHRLDVYSYEEDDKPKRSLLHLRDGLTKPNINRLVIYNKDKTYTSEYLQFTGIRPTAYTAKN
jgi:tRNA1Val (adenine37-N6)-methyltransferase